LQPNWLQIRSSRAAPRVVFLLSDDEDATAPVAALAKQLGLKLVILKFPNAHEKYHFEDCAIII
jgi:predicted dinucleotide-binding enzyme